MPEQTRLKVETQYFAYMSYVIHTTESFAQRSVILSCTAIKIWVKKYWETKPNTEWSPNEPSSLNPMNLSLSTRVPSEAVSVARVSVVTALLAAVHPFSPPPQRLRGGYRRKEGQEVVVEVSVTPMIPLGSHDCLDLWWCPWISLLMSSTPCLAFLDPLCSSVAAPHLAAPDYRSHLLIIVQLFIYAHFSLHFLEEITRTVMKMIEMESVVARMFLSC